MSKRLSESRIVVSTHYRIYSASQALRDYLRANNCSNLLYIAHPLPPKVVQSIDYSYCEISLGDKIVQKKIGKSRNDNLALSSMYDVYLILKWVIAFGKFDLFIGVNNLNAIAGIVLKRLGRVKKVVYYTIDYFPTRFENKLLNFIYHSIDNFCVKYADETWNVSSVMVDARGKYHDADKKVYNRQYRVPIGIWYDKAPRKKFSEIHHKKLIFVGQLLPHMGVELVIKSMPDIIKKIPDVKFEIIGGGEQKKYLKKLAKELNVLPNVKFWGWVRDRRKLEKIISDGAVGMATFNTDILDEKVKNADPGKIKDYMLMGMPIIVTDAISNTTEIKKNKCGIVIKYRSSDLVDAVVQLLNDKKKLREYRKNALKYVQQFDYNKIFKKNLSRVLANL